MSGAAGKSSPLIGRRIPTADGQAVIVAVRRRAAQVARIAHASKGRLQWTIWQGVPVVVAPLARDEATDLPV